MLMLAACGKPAAPVGAKKKAGEKPFPVEVLVVAERELTQTIRAPGTIEAFETIQITARVAGSLDRLKVVEGDQVAIGDLIATIDAERYRITLATAQAQLARAQAVREDASASAARREELAKVDRVPQEEAQQARMRLLQAEADLAGAQAAVERAALDLKDAQVSAPIAGIIQRREARTGAYLPIGAPLVTLIQRDPLQVHFSVAVGDAQRLRVGMVVDAIPRGATTPISATIRLIADAVDPGTRLVPIVARVAVDASGTVRPGTFAEVLMTLPARTVISVPSLALRASERGTMAYVVDGNVLQERIVTLAGQAENGELMVTSGLRVGETLAVRAADGLRQGMQVVVIKPASGTGAETGPPAAGAGSR
jgi:RND family efflux transporter MFP subunit